MKRISVWMVLGLLVLPLSLGALEPALPEHRGAVNDSAALLSPETAASLEELASALLRETGFALVILTLPSLPENTTLEEYAVNLYAKWGIGMKGKDAGALILVAVNDRQMRIEAGYGAEGYLPDAVCKRIIMSRMVPAFQQGDFNGGIASAASEIAFRVAKEFNVDPARLALKNPASARPGPDASIRLSPFHIVLIIVIFLLLVGTRPGRSLLFLFLLSNFLGSGRGSYRGGGGGFGGGFSSGGGFGGFGGGMSGGGGASGRW